MDARTTVMTESRDLRLESIASIVEVPAVDWNALAAGNPFHRHEFLAALEDSGCVGPGTAWQPCHLLLRDAAGHLVGALPLYRKYDSRGEFVFDWSWADAYERAGLEYYPKLVSAVPFTPATGTRLLLAGSADARAASAALLGGALEMAERIGASSFHVLFPSGDERAELRRAGLLERKGCQFHWTNQGYASFDEFLGRFSSAKRKKARRERRRVAEAGIEFEHLRGDEPTASDWDAIFDFYSRTFLRRGRHPYLNRAFFDRVIASMPEHLVIILARFAGRPIATAICFRDDDTLYGRYWGSLADFHSLHFEACYYQGIDYCIRERLARFEPGTQGEHKISRGFSPTATWSYHWLGEHVFRDAIKEFLARESSHVDAYMAYLDDHVPYRRAESSRP